MAKDLLLVYNADSDLKSKMLDYVHKIVSPGSYDCQLCSITHTNLGQKQEWTEFLDSIDADLKFLYKDQFLKGRAKEEHFDFPIIMYNNNLVLDKGSFQKMDLEDLKNFISELILK